MHPDREIIAKLNRLADDFRNEAEQYRIEANQMRDIGLYKDYFIMLRKYGNFTLKQIEVLMTQIDIAEKDYDEQVKLYYDSNND